MRHSTGRTKTTWRHAAALAAAALMLLALVGAPALALNPPAGDSPLAAKAFRDPALYVSSDYDRADLLGGALGIARVGDLAALGLAGDRGFVDRRTGSWGTLLPSVPLVPGAGTGNSLTWAALGLAAPATGDQLEEATWTAFEAWLTANASALRVPAAELGPRTLTAAGGQIVQINVRQAVGGVPVRGAFLSAVVNHGNLVLMGTRNWGAVAVATTPALSEAAAVAAAESFVGRSFSGYWSAPHLELVPVSVGDDPSAIAIGSGLGHRLVWAIGPHFADDRGTWEVLVDAHSGEVVAFADTNHYATKAVRGGVFPVSNDGHGVEGQEQPGYPMPFADVTTDQGTLLFTDSGGDVSCSAAGTGIRTHLDGRYVKIFDNCGPIDEHAADPDDLDLGSSPGTDCAVPPGSDSPGNTHSARTGFYEVNRIKEIARGWLPENEWLNGQITANMNIADTCNAFWNGSTINFYASGGGCRNTGEIAAVFDHEWGHGMDDNDANPSISAPGEAYADVASVLRLNDSCVARGFDAADIPCGGNGDDCTVCSGVREVDWTKRASGQPHDLDWINSPTFVAPGGCVGGIFIPTQQGPCGFGTHCEGSVASEAVWDLFKRDLPAFGGAGFAIGDSTAQELVTRLYYLGGGALGNWYNCNPAAPPGLHGDGCNADGAYLNFLAIDDDNGDLSDGTPHMPAVFAAFDRHQMACATPAPVAAASCTRPTSAPDLTVSASHKGAELSWAAVPGATKYWVFRGDGALACSFGKERIAEVAGTSYVDAGVAHDRPISYAVTAVGSADGCIGPMSACVTTTPVDGASLVFTEAAPALSGLSGGDGDVFIDNCESGTVGFAVRNDGTAALSNVRVAHVEPVSHPEIEITSTPTFATSLGPCGEAAGSFGFTAHGLAFDDEVVFRVDVTADEIAPRVISTTARFLAAESDFAPVASRTWSFPEDLEDWQVQQGTFAHNGGLGGNGTLGYLESSKLQDDTCDQVASPLVRLTGDSTLSLYNQFAIEPGESTAVGFYDRANVGIQDLAAGTRAPVSPDGGRTYNATGPNGACVTTGQPGWAGAGPGFLESTWSAAALNPGGAWTGRVVRLDVAYGTDPLASFAGIQFDEVTLTSFEEQVPDAQPDTCAVDPDPTCGAFDDADEAVEYKRGWHRRTHADASNGGYHRRMGGGGGEAPTVRVTFTGDAITYRYVKSDIGGTADVTIDGVPVETISYGPGGSGKENPTFGHSRTWSGLGAGTHELVIAQKTGAVYVDGFEVPCAAEGDGADAAAVTSRSKTTTDAASATEGAVISRPIEVGPEVEHVSVVVEGALVPLTVRLLDPLGNLLATGGALVDGLAVSGVDAVPAGTGTYRLEVLNTAGAFTTLQVSTARTVASP